VTAIGGRRAGRAEWILQMARGPAHVRDKELQPPRHWQAYARAWELGRQLGDSPPRVTALRGLQNTI